MSGGSYNYLCHVYVLDELASREIDLINMSDRLAGLGYAEDAARETEELLVMLRQWKIRSEARADRLRSVWRAVEWWDSSDWGEDSVHQALENYRDSP